MDGREVLEFGCLRHLTAFAKNVDLFRGLVCSFNVQRNEDDDNDDDATEKTLKERNGSKRNGLVRESRVYASKFGP